MKFFHEGQLVTLLDEGEELDGIVVHRQSVAKIEVAVPDAEDGVAFRTVGPKLLKERTEAGEQDDALRRLIKRTASAGRGPRTGPGGARRGHSHASGHRTKSK